jgi:hypothetical protein
LIGLLARPLLFTNTEFDTDGLLHLWYLWHQSLTIRANHFPSLFLNYSGAVFYPEFAFYGGTLTALTGVLSLILGDAPLEAYILTYCLGFAAAYGGWYWMARMAGLRSWQAHAPGWVFMTSASYITILYGRGDWPEFIAVSIIPLLVASALSVLRSERPRFWPALALAAAGVIFSGSHNMTLLWGSTFLTLMALAIVACVPEARQSLEKRRVVRVAGLLVPALLVSSWYLLPEIAYASHTWLGSGYLHGDGYWESELGSSMRDVGMGRLFTFSRATPKAGDNINDTFALPVLAMAWVLAGIPLLVRRKAIGAWMRILAIACGMTILFLAVMTHESIIALLPGPYIILQFSYRLESYVLLGLSSTVLAILVLARRFSTRDVRLWTWTLVPILALSAIGAMQQLDALHPGGNDGAILRSYLKVMPPALPKGLPKALTLEDYEDVAYPVVTPRERPPLSVVFATTAVHDDHVSEVVHIPPGAIVDSNIAGGPELVNVAGAKIVGVSSENGNDVLEVEPGADTGSTSSHPDVLPSETISLSPAHSLPVVLGHLLTVVAAIVLIAELTVLAGRRRFHLRTRRRAGGRRSFLARAGRRRAGSSRRSSRS